VLMAPLSTSEALGLYAVAVSVAELPQVFSNAFRDVLFAADARDADGTRVVRVSRASTAVTLVTSLCLGVCAPWLVPVVSGDEFRPAAWSAIVLLLAGVLGAPGSIAGAALAARGYPGRRSVSLTVGAGLNTVVLVSLVPFLGSLGAALASVAAYPIAGTMNLLWLQRLCGIPMRSMVAVRPADLTEVVRAVRERGTRAG
jgi:O-antigen/teichoic acid export membrane protein